MPRGAKHGNKNAAGKRVVMSNFAGFLTGIAQSPIHAANSHARYSKRGAGMTGHAVGVAVRRVATLHFK